MTGKELRAIRKRMGWTQVEMGECLGVSSNTIARWERGEMAVFEPAARLAKMISGQVDNPSERRGTMGPFEKFIQDSLKGFERHLHAEGFGGALEQRLRGAREFARFLLGRPPKKGERTKGTI